jgi:hypothetical protein
LAPLLQLRHPASVSNLRNARILPVCRLLSVRICLCQCRWMSTRLYFRASSSFRVRPQAERRSLFMQIKLPDFSQSRLIAPGPGIRKQVAQLSKDVNPLANRAPEVVGRSPTPKSIDLAIRSSTTRTLIAQPRSPFSPKKTSTLSSSASPAATSSLSQNEIGCMLTGDLEEKKQKRKAERYFVHLCSINPGEVSVLQCLKPKYRGQ